MKMKMMLFENIEEKD